MHELNVSHNIWAGQRRSGTGPEDRGRGADYGHLRRRSADVCTRRTVRYTKLHKQVLPRAATLFCAGCRVWCFSYGKTPRFNSRIMKRYPLALDLKNDPLPIAE